MSAVQSVADYNIYNFSIFLTVLNQSILQIDNNKKKKNDLIDEPKLQQ